MSQSTRVNGGKNKPPKAGGSNARDRARAAAAAAARKKKRRNLGLLVLAIVVVVAAVGIGIGYATNFGKPTANNAGSGLGWGPVTITNGKPITLGESNAPVTLKLYEDFRCPHCKEFENSLGPTITDLQKSGKAKVELFPLTVIDNEDGQQGSLRAGNAMACAAEDGFGQAYYTALFANYGKSWTNDQLISLANQVANPSSKFTSCVNDMKHQDWMSSAAQAANNDGVQGTPTVFINNKLEADAPGWTPQQLRDAVAKAS
jgi:protein-disulfide isomerase